ncbi:MAG: hypothetical protein IKZ53_11100 [Selenomonadaceae bacterium]|nr:hypothetical protein [Selenomonadaceae bacterium]
MDANLKIVLDQYFEGASRLKPNVFVPVRNNRVIEPLIDAFFSETEQSTLIMADYQEIFEGDILVYPKTRQFCYVDDIRHITGKGIYIVHYHTKYQCKTYTPFGEE